MIFKIMKIVANASYLEQRRESDILSAKKTKKISSVSRHKKEIVNIQMCNQY